MYSQQRKTRPQAVQAPSSREALNTELRPPTFGRVNPGWTPATWARECRRKAWASWRIQPEIAEMWLEWGFVVTLGEEKQT